VVEWADLFPELLPPETVWWRLVVLAEGGRRVERLVVGDVVGDKPSLDPLCE
jgi:hypothetical protein